MNRKIGLYGGSFDPVHWGHLLAAQAAYEEMSLDKLIFIPAAHSPFKPSSQPLAPAQRARLLRLALAGRAEFEVCERELRRGGVSFTIDTVKKFASEYPSARLTCLIGTDHLETLPQWKEAEALAEKVDFAVIPRPGQQWKSPEFPCRRLRGWPIEVSSSSIRERLRSGRPVDWLLPAAVAETIRQERLYLDG